ncbi:MAG: hypothetical protein A3C30_00715 [Candidatus Levybacteria bacterium RIFCSPHIGHO2_02_FULL_40_18]|nr:MAG: hypothetical protein A2869_03215 [Candidatus Levybacteria bacterium RIFCSPHIGHO2_01_FULL_40_58]OGH27223.1 MAG: hypothetical protein A3C30_00715 [Candidatus Levybacteria bacterium RIFCSPHIGHO2_02_FULL_40_18]OGH31082.1 MAG: hypothetical protein A3E43_05130 [Candidatus Levybacteria bacterium RIFCSPHIGHO2_12_FULL_40_31]OGH40750.1 MAG: hypothetical protein A2894_03310 [Candidatus Levybacteria bacterium RIFCSPLOWO2_01_FULL_40_64]OGH49388.1 MAG: hypothetical protein A3I54_01950 [Candidatus Lev
MKLALKYWPIIFIVGVWLVFAHPYFIFGKVPFPSGYLVNFFAPWNAVPDFAGPYKNGATPDVITQIYPWKNLVIDFWKQGSIPLWNPYSFSGTPLLANYQSAALSPLNLLYLILPFIDAWSIAVLLQSLLAGLFTYLYIRTLKLSEFGAIVSSIAFMFAGFITTWMSYQTLGYAILFLPLSLFAVEKFFETKKWQYALLLSATIPLSFFSGHFQTSLYFLLFIFFYTTFKLVVTKNLKSYILNLSSIIFGLLISSPQILPSIELYLNSVRSEIFSAVEIIPWSYLPTLIAPDFYGNPVTRNNWLGHYAEWNGYIGLIPLILGFYALTQKKSRGIILFFFSVAIISILLAFRGPLLDLLINLKVPVLSTSAASRIIVITSFCFAVLSGFGFEKIIEDIKKRNFKPLVVLFLIFGAIFVLLWGIVLLKLFIPEDKVRISFSNLRLPTLIFGSMIAIAVSAIFVRNKKFISALPIFLILIVAFDLLRFAIKWQPFEPRKFVYPELPISKFLSTIKPYDRIFGNFGAEVANTYKASYIEGYDPLYISRYGEFIATASDGKFHKAQRSGVVFPKRGDNTQNILNFLGVKYIIHKIADGRYAWAYPFWEYPVDYFTPVYKDASYEVYQNQKVFPRSFVVGKYRVESSSQKLLSMMFDNDSNLKEEAFLEENIDQEISSEVRGETAIKSYKPNEIIIEASSSGAALLVLSDPFYPGWKAFVDGSPTNIYRTNYAFRGIVVPVGRHLVRFTYEPDSFRIGTALGLLGLLGIGGMILYLRKR